jgi:hypothetical protein
MSERVTALFPTRDDAERAAAALMDHGVTREEISLLARGPIRGEVPDPADPKALTYTSDADPRSTQLVDRDDVAVGPERHARLP